ncbi:hypothetical protein RUND412_008961 [Rhizina undulata]
MKKIANATGQITMDPTILHHPTPVRNLILQIPVPLLQTLLTHHAYAFQPQEPHIESLTPDSLKISYLQPVREIWYNPLPLTFTIPFDPPLPPLPLDAEENEHSAYRWEKVVADRLKEMEAESTRINQGRSEIVVTRYIPPFGRRGFLAIALFVVLTGAIVCWLVGGRDAPVLGMLLGTVFKEEWRFNAAVLVHCGILVRKSREVVKMGERLRRHQVGDRRVWLWWMVMAGLEGWRCAKRFEEEVERVGREIAVKKLKGKSKE